MLNIGHRQVWHRSLRSSVFLGIRSNRPIYICTRRNGLGSMGLRLIRLVSLWPE